MNSIERKRTIAKLVLIVSTTLLILLILVQFFPTVISSIQTTTDTPPPPKNLKDAKNLLLDKYKENTLKIKTDEEKSKELNDSIALLNSYADKKIPMYAIGAGISIIVGLWISTLILYFKEREDLFKE